MKVKTKDLTGAALDWAVASIEGKTRLYQIRRGRSRIIDVGHPDYVAAYLSGHTQYSTDWAKGGPIIEREKINVKERHQAWIAYIAICDGMTDRVLHGSTFLEAAMRCFVQSRLGDEVEIPDILA